MNNGEKNETDPRQIADAFNDYFINISKNIQEKIAPTRKHFSDYLKQPSANSFFFRPIKVEEITKIITNLDPKKATGPFSIPNKILMILKDEISMILTEIFNLSLTSGKFIDKLKMTRVIPLYKNKGSEQDKSNYRSIALLSNIDKIFEKLIHQRFVSFLEKNDAIFERQFGFCEKHSTTHNLITITETIRKHLDGGEFSCAVFLDLQKAFDSVDHENGALWVQGKG